MDKLAHSSSPILNPDRNPLLRFFLKKTFYAQFCAGETPAEVARTVASLKSLGFRGVALGYAKEVVLDEGAVSKLAACGDNSAAEECIQQEILPWKEGTLKTVDITSPGEFVSIKFTGAGSQALFNLSQNHPPSPALDAAITEVCDRASDRGVRLLFDAEQQSLQKGIDTWTVNYMRKYNSREPGKATIYNTYQCYLKAIPTILSSHLAIARKEGFTLGAKLVRGAYLGSDPRELINDTKEDTDEQYDSIAESLMRRQYGDILKPAQGEEGKEMPPLCMVLAGHNHVSVRRALAIRTEQARLGQPRVPLIYAQLMGMADEVSCDLLQVANAANEGALNDNGLGEGRDIPQAFKYLVWGSTGECMKYLLRRARENKDAVGRTKEGRDAMVKEVFRRAKATVGLGAN